MKTKFLNATLTGLVVLFSTVRVDAQISAIGRDRAVAVTFDDLPVISLRHDLVSQSIITRKLLNAIKSNRVPAIGFVNENKLLTDGTLDERLMMRFTFYDIRFTSPVAPRAFHVGRHSTCPSFPVTF